MRKTFRYLTILVALLGLGGALSAEIRVTTADALKAAVTKTQPEYPPVAKQMKITGQVDVEVTIDADGNVENVRVLAGNSLLTGAVITAVKKWKFTPFTQDGAATKAIALLDFNFKF